MDLRKKQLEIKKQDDLIIQRHSFSDMVDVVNDILVDRFDQRIQRRQYAVLSTMISEILMEHDFYMPGIPHNRLVNMIFDSITGYDILHPFIANPDIRNIEVEGPNEVYVMENLQWKQVPVSFGSERNLEQYIYRLFNRLGSRFSIDNPLAKVEDPEWNLRIRASGYDINPDSPALSIRKLSSDILTEEQIRYSMSESIEKFLRFAVKAGFTIGIVGPFGSGKTTLLGTLLSWIPPYKHVGLIQSSNEIQRVHPLMRRHLTREMTGESSAVIDENMLLEFAKQESFQVISLGEFLNEAALTMLHILQLQIQTLFSYHANSARGAIHSFNYMMMQAGKGYSTEYLTQELAENFDIVIVTDRLRIREIAQYTGTVDENTYTPHYEILYRFRVQEEHRHQLVGNWERDFNVKLCPKLIDKARLNGVVIPPELQLV